MSQVFRLVIFTVPSVLIGVLIGGLIGPAISNRVPQHVLKKSLGGLFISISSFLIER